MQDAIKAMITGAYTQIRDIFGSVEIMHNGRKYTAPAQSVTSTFNGSEIALMQDTVGSVRLLTSELRQGHYPKTGEEIQVKTLDTKEWQTFTILDASPQYAGESVLIQYGVQDAG